MIGAIVVSVDQSTNKNQKFQNPVVQAMRQGNIVSYHTTSIKSRN
jgi:hypothetical protein